MAKNCTCSLLLETIDKIFIDDSCCCQKTVVTPTDNCCSCEPVIDLIDTDKFACATFSDNRNLKYQIIKEAWLVYGTNSDTVYNAIIDSLASEIMLLLKVLGGGVDESTKNYVISPIEISRDVEAELYIVKYLKFIEGELHICTYTIHKIDLNNYETNWDSELLEDFDIDQYYTKTESDAKYATILYLTNNYYNTSTINTNFYNKTEIDNKILWEQGEGELSTQRIGSGCQAKGKYSLAAGTNNKTEGQGSVVFGYGNNNYSGSDYTFNIGYRNEVTGSNNIMAGNHNTINGEYNITAGRYNKVNGNYNFAAGLGRNDSIECECDYSGVLGLLNKVKGDHSFVGGYNNETTGKYSAILGASNTVKADYSSTLGSKNEVYSQKSIAIGSSNKINEDTADKDNSFAIGSSNNVKGSKSIALGHMNTTTADTSYAIGYQNYANSIYSIAMNLFSRANGLSSIAGGRMSYTGSIGAHATGNAIERDYYATLVEYNDEPGWCALVKYNENPSIISLAPIGLNSILDKRFKFLKEGIYIGQLTVNIPDSNPILSRLKEVELQDGHLYFKPESNSAINALTGHIRSVSFSSGYDGCKANALGSHAEGYGTVATGIGSHSEGIDTFTLNQGEHACGKYNYSENGKTIFSVGIGSEECTDSDDYSDVTITRKNALEITNDGKIYIRIIDNTVNPATETVYDLGKLLTILIDSTDVSEAISDDNRSNTGNNEDIPAINTAKSK